MVYYKDVNKFYDGKEETSPNVLNMEEVFQSIQTIIETPKYTRAFLPEFGVEIDQYLFQLNTPESRLAIVDEIIRAVQRWDSRVKIIRKYSDVSPHSIDNHEYKVTLAIRIDGFDDEIYIFEKILNAQNYKKGQ